MDEDTLKELKELNNISDFINYIKPFYPDLTIRDYTIENIETELNRIFVKIVGKIMSFSPQNMRDFLKDYLLRFEIMNIKQIILGSIMGMSKEEKSRDINYVVEEYLDNVDFIKGLLDKPSLDEIRLYMQGTMYNKAIREGLLYFRNYNEIFVLEAFLDQLYYTKLKNRKKFLNKKEKKLIGLFIDIMIEIYNLNIIYRGILNNIDKILLSQFLVDNHLFLNAKNLQTLLNQTDINSFFSLIEEFFNDIEEIKDLYHKFGIKKEHFYWSIEGLYINYFFNKYKAIIDDIDYSTILRIVEVLMKKEKEIQFDILPNVVNIIHDKYNKLI
jgi:vacuolar-type H+-ATPase subunit C/Vma6